MHYKKSLAHVFESQRQQKQVTYFFNPFDIFFFGETGWGGRITLTRIKIENNYRNYRT